VAELYRKHGMSDASFYNWRAKYGGMDVSMMKRMKDLEEENRCLKKMHVEERLKDEVLQDAFKKVVKPSRRKEMAKKAVEKRQMSIRLACEAFVISETCYRYQAKLSGPRMSNIFIRLYGTVRVDLMPKIQRFWTFWDIAGS